jgi:hypothetical protein
MGAPKLIILSEQLRGQKFDLTDDVHTCGRVDDRDIHIPDPTVSTHHCDFVKRGDTYVLVDHNSTNGTRVNNIPISEQELQNTDILQIGGIEVLYDCDDKSMTTVLKTQTGINLDGMEGTVSTVRKMDNASPFSKGGKSGKSHAIIVGSVIFLVLVVIVLSAWLAYIMFFKEGGNGAGVVEPPRTAPRHHLLS